MNRLFRKILALGLLSWAAVVLVFSAFVMLHPEMAQAAERYMAMQYNANVRIVLASTPCPDGKGWRAVAQRIDKQYMRACWTREPADKLIRIQWEGGDFSVFDAARFSPVEVQDADQ